MPWGAGEGRREVHVVGTAPQPAPHASLNPIFYLSLYLNVLLPN